jgi:hypothetical protein
MAMPACLRPPMEDKYNPKAFHVDYFIVGRIRSSKLEEAVFFKVNVFSINRALVDQQLKLRILDSLHFEIKYQLGGKEYTRQGVFDAEVREMDFHLLVQKVYKTSLVKDEAIRNMAFLFQVQPAGNRSSGKSD